jgi:GNAT superfamily N-acetyltransferase
MELLFLDKMEIIIKKANAKDVDAVVSLINEYDIYEKKLDKNVEIEKKSDLKKAFLEDLETKRAYYYIASIQNSAGGLIIYSIYRSGKAKWAVLQDLIINEKYRGFGIGKKLVSFVIKKVKIMGCKRIKSFVRFNNKKALGFWKKQGFKTDANKGYSIIKQI